LQVNPHCPALQAADASGTDVAQAMPQPPQLATSVCSSTQTASHSVQPGSQVNQHWLMTQAGTA
jgi:hypothetical protein